MKAFLKKASFMTLAIPLMFIGSVTGASAEEPTKKTITYACSGPTIDFNMDATISTNVPASVAPGEQVTFNDSTVSVKLPPLVVDTLRFVYSAQSISGEVTKFNLSSDNLQETINVADPAISIPNTPLPSLGQPLEFTVPETGGLTVGPFTAGPSGEMTITSGDLETTIVAHGLFSDSNIDVSCTPSGDDVLAEIPIQ